MEDATDIYDLGNGFIKYLTIQCNGGIKRDIMCVLEGRQDIMPINCMGTEGYKLIDSSFLPWLF